MCASEVLDLWRSVSTWRLSRGKRAAEGRRGCETSTSWKVGNGERRASTHLPQPERWHSGKDLPEGARHGRGISRFLLLQRLQRTPGAGIHVGCMSWVGGTEKGAGPGRAKFTEAAKRVGGGAQGQIARGCALASHGRKWEGFYYCMLGCIIGFIRLIKERGKDKVKTPYLD